MVPSATRWLPSISKLLNAKFWALAAPAIATKTDVTSHIDRTATKPCAKTRHTRVIMLIACTNTSVAIGVASMQVDVKTTNARLRKGEPATCQGQRIVSFRIVKVINDKMSDRPTNMNTLTA